MKWSSDSFEKEVKSYAFFQDYNFRFVRKEIGDAGTKLECHVARLDNRKADRSLEITFVPSHIPDKLAMSKLYIVKLSTDDGFNLKDYINQYHNIKINLDDFRYISYPGSYPGNFEEKVREFLDFATELLKKYAIPILQGKEWPDVNFDWQGYR